MKSKKAKSLKPMKAKAKAKARLIKPVQTVEGPTAEDVAQAKKFRNFMDTYLRSVGRQPLLSNVGVTAVVKYKHEYDKHLWQVQARCPESNKTRACGQATKGNFGDAASNVAAAMALLISEGYAKDDVADAKSFLRDLEQTKCLWGMS